MPGSKSHTIRGLILALLAKGNSQLTNALECTDTRAAMSVCAQLGAQIHENRTSNGQLDLKIDSLGLPLQSQTAEIFSGNSGITTAFIAPILGLRCNSAQKITLKCGEQMMRRPLTPIITALSQLGLQAKSIQNNNSCPLELSGTLTGGKIELHSDNSQPLSALLLALPSASHVSEIAVHSLQERPYIEMTLQWLDELKIEYSHQRFSEKQLDIFKIFGNQTRHNFSRKIPGDFTSASYFIAAASAIKGEVILQGLDLNDTQGDQKIIEILKLMGGQITIENQNIKIQGGSKLHGIAIDCGDIPDLIPTLAVLATQAEGTTKLFNVAHARIKETDRLTSMATQLKRMGAQIEEQNDALIIQKSKLYSAALHGYYDHRTIMALTVAGLLAEGETTIDTAENIKKTFPNFIETISSLGAKVTINP